MYLTRHEASGGLRRAADGHRLPGARKLGSLPPRSRPELRAALVQVRADEPVSGPPRPVPIDAGREAWAAGATCR